MRSFFDTNVLVYLFDRDAPDKQETSRTLFASEAQSGRLIISTQVLQEWYVTVTRKLAEPLPAKDAEQTLRHFSAFPVVRIDIDHVLGPSTDLRSLDFRFGTPSSSKPHDPAVQASFIQKTCSIAKSSMG